MPDSRVKTIHDSTYQVLVECLRTARQNAGVTQIDLAASLSVDQSYISKYERAERRLDVIELRDICRALNLDFLEFIASFEQELKQRGLS